MVKLGIRTAQSDLSEKLVVMEMEQTTAKFDVWMNGGAGRIKGAQQ